MLGEPALLFRMILVTDRLEHLDRNRTIGLGRCFSQRGEELFLDEFHGSEEYALRPCDATREMELKFSESGPAKEAKVTKVRSSVEMGEGPRGG